jgi:hypothetical protein
MPLIVKDGIDIETKESLELGGRNTYKHGSAIHNINTFLDH